MASVVSAQSRGFAFVHQVLYKKNRHSHPNVMKTNTTSVELALPTDEDYIIQIKPFGEGGDGSSSKQITIPRIPGQQRASSCLPPWWLAEYSTPLLMQSCQNILAIIAIKRTEGTGLTSTCCSLPTFSVQLFYFHYDQITGYIHINQGDRNHAALLCASVSFFFQIHLAFHFSTLTHCMNRKLKATWNLASKKNIFLDLQG